MIKLGESLTMPNLTTPSKVWTLDEYGDGKGQIRKPLAVCALHDGLLAVADVFNYRVQVFDEQGHSHAVLGHREIDPRGVAVTRHGHVAVADVDNKCVHVYDAHADHRLATWGMYEYPCGIACTLDDDFYVTDIQNHTVTSHDSNGRVTAKFQYADPYMPRGPAFIAADQRGRLLVSHTLESTIHVFDLRGQHIKDIGGPGHTAGQFNQQHSIAIDNSDNIIVADTGNNRVTLLSPEGHFITHLLTLDSDLIHDPRGVTLDSTGHLILSLYDESRVTKYKMFHH